MGLGLGLCKVRACPGPLPGGLTENTQPSSFRHMLKLLRP
jgi:hypothetical protein